MKTHLKILSLFVVLTSVLMKSGDVFEGTVGEKVEIICPYPDGYTYTPKYLCRDPCGGSQHVLIKSEKTDQVVFDGRYSLINTANSKIFTVTIRDLRLKDSGVYYCGLDKWFKDTLKKVHLTVHQAAPVNRPSQTSEKTITTTITWTTTTLTSAVTSSLQTNDTFYKNNSTSYEQFSPTVQSKAESFFSVAVVCASVLVLLVFGVFVASAFLCKRSHSMSRWLNFAVPENSVQDSPDLNQTVDDVHHIYDEMVTENSLAGPARDDNFSVIYSTVQYCGPAPQDDVNDFYSLITHHTPHTEDK